MTFMLGAGFASEALLVGAVITVGVLHTVVPDHWLPIALVARQQGWSRRETAEAALRAGTGHVVTTLLIGVVVWIAGAAFAMRFGTLVSIVSSLALIAFGGWIALSSLRELRQPGGHGTDSDCAPPAASRYGEQHGLRDDAHAHVQPTSGRTALLLILGSSPMVEGIPAFFAAGKYGAPLIIVMSVAFAVSTIATYVTLCVYSVAGLQRLRLGPFEKYGEVFSGAFIALVGLIFIVFPIL